VEGTATSHLVPPVGLPWPGDGEAGLLADMLDAAPIGFACFDHELRFLHVNRRVLEVTGLPREEHVGRTMREVVPDLADVLEAHARAVLTSGRAQPSVEISGEVAGARSHWTTSWYPVRDSVSGRLRGVAVLATDVTGLVAATEAVRQTALTCSGRCCPAPPRAPRSSRSPPATTPASPTPRWAATGTTSSRSAAAGWRW
jgi:PAS domain S-box-containing protein